MTDIVDRYRRAEGLSQDTKHRLTMLNTFIHDGESPIEPLEPERPAWNWWVGFFSMAAAMVMALFLFASAVGVI